MLQHNAHRAGRRAHVAHGAVVAVHALCCGLPALAMTAAVLSGAASGAAVLPENVNIFHNLLHEHELWIIAVSAVLVVAGGVLEATARREGRRGFPWLFAFSAVCFFVNVGIIAFHQAL